MGVASARSGLPERLLRLFANDPAAMEDPYPALNELRDTACVYELGAMALITRYEAVREASRDTERLSSRTFTGSRAEAALARFSDSQREAYRIVSEFESRYVSRSDSEQHARLRRVMQRAFVPRRIADLRPRIQRISDQLIDHVAAQAEPDLVGFAWKLPLMVVGELLEVPPEDIDRIHGWSGAIGRNRRGVDPTALMGALEAIAEFRVYVDEMVQRHRESPRESDLVALLLDAQDGDHLSADELTAMFVILLFAGHETTTGLISNGIVALLRHPDQWRLLTEDPELAEPAVDELLRFVTPVQWTWRVTTGDYECDGRVIPAGTTVALVLAAANRDPAAFERPEEFDLRRPDAARHLAFGLGPHFCIGSALARLEVEIALRGLAERFPDMCLADARLQWRGNAMIRQVAELPVHLDGHPALPTV
jgi:cytochrome P450